MLTTYFGWAKGNTEGIFFFFWREHFCMKTDDLINYAPVIEDTNLIKHTHHIHLMFSDMIQDFIVI